MDNLLDRIDYNFDGNLPELTDKRENDFMKRDVCSPLKNFDNSFVKSNSNSRIDILPDIENFNFPNKASHRKFSDTDFKYLLQKSPTDVEQRKLAKSKKESEDEEREKMQVLVSNFTEDQLDRYEMYRRAAFPRAAIKRIMQMITGNSVSQNVVIAMSGIAKVFIGEIVEEALNIMESQNDVGPLQPKHLREAVRRLRANGKIPGLKDKKPNYRF